MMLRLLALPFAILLGALSLGLIAGGVSILGEEPSSREDGGSSLFDLDVASDDRDEADHSGAIAGASMLGFGVLGLIAAIALLIASLSGHEKATAAPFQQQQQQQQVIVVDRDASFRYDERR